MKKAKLGANGKPLMVCAKAVICTEQKLYTRPIWEKLPHNEDEGIQIGVDVVKQGHCTPHGRMSTCGSTGKMCPACNFV